MEAKRRKLKPSSTQAYLKREVAVTIPPSPMPLPRSKANLQSYCEIIPFLSIALSDGSFDPSTLQLPPRSGSQLTYRSHTELSVLFSIHFLPSIAVYLNNPTPRHPSGAMPQVHAAISFDFKGYKKQGVSMRDFSREKKKTSQKHAWNRGKCL